MRYYEHQNDEWYENLLDELKVPCLHELYATEQPNSRERVKQAFEALVSFVYYDEQLDVLIRAVRAERQCRGRRLTWEEWSALFERERAARALK